MRYCALCKKKFLSGGGVSLFEVPKDATRRVKWSQICGKELKRSAQLCEDHFDKKFIVAGSKKVWLMPSAEPIADTIPSAIIEENGPRSPFVKQWGNTTIYARGNAKLFSWEELTGAAAANSQTEDHTCNKFGNYCRGTVKFDCQHKIFACGPHEYVLEYIFRNYC